MFNRVPPWLIVLGIVFLVGAEAAIRVPEIITLVQKIHGTAGEQEAKALAPQDIAATIAQKKMAAELAEAQAALAREQAAKTAAETKVAELQAAKTAADTQLVRAQTEKATAETRVAELQAVKTQADTRLSIDQATAARAQAAQSSAQATKTTIENTTTVATIVGTIGVAAYAYNKLGPNAKPAEPAFVKRTGIVKYAGAEIRTCASTACPVINQNDLMPLNAAVEVRGFDEFQDGVRPWRPIKAVYNKKTYVGYVGNGYVD